MTNIDYKKAYERSKQAREQAEDALENRSRELYDSKEQLEQAYEKLKSQKSHLLHQEKLASIGQLSAGVAHEINNPVGFIKSNLTTLQKYNDDLLALLSLYQTTVRSKLDATEISDIVQLEDKCDIDFIIEDLPTLITESLDGAERIADIVNELKTFSRIDSDEKEPLDVNLCIENTIKLVINEIKFKATLTQELGDIPLTTGFPGNFRQVILNILVNASHAIPESSSLGNISIKTYQDKQWIIVLIEDDGCGMNEIIMNKIFDPFYTTKEVGVGTGLGLSISSGIIKKHDGKIEVDSTPGEGTRFTIYLPIITSD